MISQQKDFGKKVIYFFVLFVYFVDKMLLLGSGINYFRVFRGLLINLPDFTAYSRLQ